jgi:hypothetical protein
MYNAYMVAVNPGFVRFEVLTVVRMTMLFFWIVTPCRLIDRHQRFEEIVSIFRAEDGDSQIPTFWRNIFI